MQHIQTSSRLLHFHPHLGWPSFSTTPGALDKDSVNYCNMCLGGKNLKLGKNVQNVCFLFEEKEIKNSRHRM